MTFTRTLLAASLPLLLSGTAQAETMRQRIARAAAHGPVVYQVDSERARFAGPPVGRGGEDLVAMRAVPVPSVMNGGGFGLSGTGYYSDGPSEAPPDARRRRNDYVLAPALRAPFR